MPKRATRNRSTQQQGQAAKVTKNEFLKSLDKYQQAAKAATKAERSQGILDDVAILTRLGIDAVDESVTLPARVSKVAPGFAKKDKAKPYYRFAFNLSENSPHTEKGKGLIISQIYMLYPDGGDGWERTEEDAWNRCMFAFRDLGEDTSEWEDKPKEQMWDAAERHTKEKTQIQLKLSCYEKENKDLGLRINVVNVLDNDDLQTDDTEDTDTGDSNDEDQEDYSTWNGETVDWTDSEGTLRGVVQSYNETDHTWEIKDEEGNLYDAPVDQCEHVDTSGE
jgi:hypothetical protein